MLNELLHVEGRSIDEYNIVASDKVHPSYKDFYEKFYYRLQNLLSKYSRIFPDPFDLEKYESFLLDLISHVGNVCKTENGLDNFTFDLGSQSDYKHSKPTLQHDDLKIKKLINWKEKGQVIYIISENFDTKQPFLDRFYPTVFGDKLFVRCRKQHHYVDSTKMQDYIVGHYFFGLVGKGHLQKALKNKA